MKLFYKTGLMLFAFTVNVQAENNEFFNDLVIRNINVTDFSAIIKISSIDRYQDINTDSGKTGYINYQFRAEVKKVLKGELTQNIVFYDTAESGNEPQLNHKLRFVSLCVMDSKLFIPGNGYLITATDALIESVRKNQSLEQHYNYNACK